VITERGGGLGCIKVNMKDWSDGKSHSNGVTKGKGSDKVGGGEVS